MYKVKINCNCLRFNNEKITKKNAHEIIKLLKINSYNYITSCTLLYKTYKKHNTKYTQKTLELYTNKTITNKQLLKMISKLHSIGITCNKNENSNINFIDNSDYSILFGYDFYKNALTIEPRYNHYKNSSSYSTHVLFTQS